MSSVFQILNSARTHLNDDAGAFWPDIKLIPKLQEAHREIQNELVLNGVQVMNDVSTILTVPALVTDDSNLDLSTVSGYPTNIISPIMLKERQVGEQFRDFVDMTQTDFIPYVDKDIILYFWSWENNTIMVRGALNPVQVQIRYRGGLAIPSKLTDDVGIILGETFLSYKTAYLALNATTAPDSGKLQSLATQAEYGKDMILSIAVKETQDMPARRRAYHRGRGRSRVLRDF